MKRPIARIGAFACSAALAASMLAGCANSAMNAATSEQQANRSYMSQVNEIMTELDAGLDLFVDAVSRGDVVNMRSQADNAYQALSKLDKLEAPESLSDVQKKYEDGTAKLREALDAYVTLYIDAGSPAFDWATYDTRIASVQKLYDEGVEALQEGDETAASKS